MAFTYSGNPSATALDLLRFLVGDTVEAVSLLSDAECQYLLTTYSTATAATLPALRAMLAKLAHDTLITVDGVTRDLEFRRTALEVRIQQVERQAGYTIFFGGISQSARDAERADTDRIQPAFHVPQPVGRFDEESA